MQEEIFTHVQIDTNKNMPIMHSHEVHELYFTLKGSLTFYIGNEILYVEKDNFVLIPKGVLHRTFYQPNTAVERIVLMFSDDLFTEEMADIHRDFLTLKLVGCTNHILPSLLSLMDQIEYEYLHDAPCRKLMIQLLITELLILLFRHKRTIRPAVPAIYATIQQIAEYISAHYEEPLSLYTISRTFHLSQSYLSRRFKEYAGIGMNEYITYVRISNAERLLMETDLSVAQVANRCGFDDSNYFSTVYKKIRGVTPRSCLKSRSR